MLLILRYKSVVGSHEDFVELQAQADLCKAREEKVRQEMLLAARKDRREEYLARLERERVDLERERLRRELDREPETRRETRDLINFLR